MIRAHVVIATRKFVGHKVVRCFLCGKEVPYQTKPPKYCAKHVRKSPHVYSQARYQAKRLAQLQVIAPEKVIYMIDGFCTKCGSIRLSAANVGGVCDWCVEDALDKRR